MESRPGTDRGASHDPSVQPPAPAPEKASVFEDFIDIFYAPSTVFARREKSGFGLPLLIISLLSALFAFANRSVMSQIADAEYTRRMAKMMASNPQFTQEMADRGRGMSQAIGSSIGYVITPIIIFVIALLLWAAARVLSSKISYSQTVLITCLAWIPRLAGSVLMTVQTLLMDTSNVTSMFALSASPARFMNGETANPKLYGVMGSLDVFSIWFTVLAGIGIAVMGKVPRARGYAAAAIVFVIGVIPLLFA